MLTPDAKQGEWLTPLLLVEPSYFNSSLQFVTHNFQSLTISYYFALHATTPGFCGFVVLWLWRLGTVFYFKSWSILESVLTSVPYTGRSGWQLGWHSTFFPHLPPLGPWFESHWRHYVNWICSPSPSTSRTLVRIPLRALCGLGLQSLTFHL